MYCIGGYTEQNLGCNGAVDPVGRIIHIWIPRTRETDSEDARCAEFAATSLPRLCMCF
jgi:hypothetical protein